MAKLTEFKNPFSGDKGSITDLGGLWNYILGVIVLFFVFATGQRLAGVVSKKVPFVDTQIDPVISQPPASNSPTVNWL